MLQATELVPILNGLPADAPDQHTLAVVYLACGITHQSIADQLGVDRVTVSRWAIKYRDHIKDIRAQGEKYLDAVHHSSLKVLVSKGLMLAQRLDLHDRDVQRKFSYLVRGMECLDRMITGQLGNPKGGVRPHTPDRRLLKEAESRFRALQSA